MNFKDEYQKSFADIKASDDFKQNLLTQMNMEKKRKRKPSYAGMLAAAAVMVLVVGAGFMTGMLRGKEQPQTDETDYLVMDDIEDSQENISVEFENEMMAGQDMSENHVEMNFSGLSWYGSSKTQEELLTVFVSLVTGDNVKSVYCTTEEDFDGVAAMSAAEQDELVKMLSDMSCTTEEYAGESTFYKVVFEDGLTIKFRISDEGYLKLQDTGAVFKISL